MEYISAEGLKKLNNELDERRTKKRKDIAKRLEDAKALGDLSENAEYSAAKEAQAFNEGRIMELEEIIREAALIAPEDRGAGKDEVVMGSEVEVKMMDGQKEIKTFVIVGSQEASPLEGRISNESPLGRAFLGRRVGETVEADTPKGKTKYKILNIR